MFTGLTRQEQRALLLVLFIAVGGMVLHQIRNDGRDADLILDAQTGEVIVGAPVSGEPTHSPAIMASAPAPIDINSAGLTALLTLPGIGEVKARSIIDERERGGPFTSVQDLTRVSGIGDRTVERLESLVTVGGVTPPDPTPHIRIITPEGTDVPPVVATPGLINVNTASLDELKTLPGIGDVMAQRIVDHREAYGPFRQPQDLLNVPRIGEVTLQRLAPLITF